MRKSFFVAALVVCVAAPAAAQNTDIESLSGLQFNFGNPGARALGMGGAFLGLADDASAVEANPAGLTILRKPEFSIEVRNYMEAQLLTTSGTFPDLERTAFNHHSNRAPIAFASAVYPIRSFTVGAYFHEALRNKGAGAVVPREDNFGRTVNVPNFYLPSAAGSTPVSRAECERMRQEKNDFFACLEWQLNPFVSAVDVQQRTWGLTGAWQAHPQFSIGATVRYQTLREESLTLRVTPDLQTAQVTVQATAHIDEEGRYQPGEESDITFAAGLKWTPTEKLSFGAVYKKGPSFTAPVFYGDLTTGFALSQVEDTQFHIPDIAGVGVSFRPIPVLTINFDAVHVTYSNLVDDFFSFSESVRDAGAPYEADDVIELRLGAEYAFTTRVPFLLRAGVWRDPAHSVTYRGPLDSVDRVAEAILFPEGEDQMHLSIGGGLAWPRFQIDFAYDTSKFYKVGSVSMVTRF
ncbi:MAG TPA: outer membrane protein transport protein [Thermoanaerobaculia bacterium]|nr:outer membrane protein transport protein [Thermoanaerobaculia bacterium]